jgi:hypothetical protein
MRNKVNDYTNLLSAFTNSMYSPDSFNLISQLLGEPAEKPLYEKLNHGFELRPINIYTKDNKTIIENREKFSQLYHNGVKVSDDIFRIGGSCGGFNDGYCKLIHYTKVKQSKDNKFGFDSGKHVIINESGKICLSGNSYHDYPTHIGGHIASMSNYIYDLRSGTAIAPKSSTSIQGLNCVIIDHRYSWYDKEVTLPVGIYKIDYKTAEITLLDNVK